MPAKFTAESDPPDDEGERGATMTVAIELGGTRSVLVLESGLGPCEDVSAVVEPVPDSGGRVALANLACDNGEDFATKESLTALIIVGSDGAARVAWQGESLSRRDISCYTNDTVHFEMRGGRVAVIRTKETYGEDRARHR